MRLMGTEKPTGSKENEIVLGILSEREANMSSMKPCSLSKYRLVVSALPRPSNKQIDNFVRFVSEAHSWYKHLPILPPGAPFHFFVDPFSGTDRIFQPGGKVIHKERTKNSLRFHYTWMSTRAYRLRFGHLSYESFAAPQFFLRTEGAEGTMQEYADLPIFSTSQGAYRIPQEVARVGSVEVTAVIHSRTAMGASFFVWERFLHGWKDNSSDESLCKWPTETGGDETLRKIIDVCERIVRDGLESGRIIPELESLLLPERQRLQRNMTEAINRVLDLLYEDGSGSA